MEFVCQRKNRRYKLTLPASVSDRQQKNVVPCMIRDGSISGCKVISNKVSELPENVLIKIPNLDQLIEGCIKWRKQDSAGIEFKWGINSLDDRRDAPRQNVAITAVIMDHDLNKLTDCIICDASRTGCRITSDALSTLPDDLYIEIPGMSEPVQARIVSRKDNMAHLKFALEGGVHVLDDTRKE